MTCGHASESEIRTIRSSLCPPHTNTACVIWWGKMSEVKCLNPWDPQSKRQYRIDGVYATLNAGQAVGGQAHGICYTISGKQQSLVTQTNLAATIGANDYKEPQSVVYCVDGNVVDRVSAKNGKGWCENVCPTLNTQDKHAVVFALEGNGARPSHMGKGFSEDGLMYTLNTIEQHSVCYAVENHPNDSRCRIDPDGIVQTLSSRMGTGGNNTPFVLIAGGEEA